MRRWGAGFVALAFLMVVASRTLADSELPAGPKATAPGHRRCGTKALFGHQFPIEAQGIGCTQARRLIAQERCPIRVKKQWSCTSFREDEPFLAWFPTEDLFRRILYPTALLRRYPCSQAKVTPSLFSVATKRFPTRRQLLADDVLRCELLAPGDSLIEAEGVLGPPDESENDGEILSAIYGLGLERSVFQIDSEILLIESKHGQITSLSIEQT